MKTLSTFYSDDELRVAHVCLVTDEAYHHFKVLTIYKDASHTKRFSFETEAEEYAENWVLQK